jgi:hypothetical protein
MVQLGAVMVHGELKLGEAGSHNKEENLNG